MLVKNNEELIGKAHELLILKMYSQNVPEALKAIEVSGNFLLEISYKVLIFIFNRYCKNV